MYPEVFAVPLDWQAKYNLYWWFQSHRPDVTKSGLGSRGKLSRMKYIADSRKTELHAVMSENGQFAAPPGHVSGRLSP